MIVPKQCLPLLKEQRTSYTDPARQYGEELARTFDGLLPHLPPGATRILDIGCGMAGIDVHLAKHYPDAEIHLLDKQGVSDRIVAGFNPTAEAFCHYHDFDAALALLEANGVKNPVVCHDGRLPACEFDVVISLLSWGFHYPIATYRPWLARGGVIVADVRKGTDGEAALAERGRVAVVHESKKFRRVVVRC